MKQYYQFQLHLGLFLVFCVISFSFQFKHSSKLLTNVKPHLGFKCNEVTDLPIAIRMNSIGEIQCFSTNGRQCSPGLHSDKECMNFINKNMENFIPITCKNLDFLNVNHWCYKAYSFFFKRWHCPEETGLEVAIKMEEGSTNVECLSKNGQNCLFGRTAEKSCKRANTCRAFQKKMRTLACGNQLEKIYKHSGYFFPEEHWCKLGLAYFRYTSDFLCNERTSLDTPIRLGEKGDIECISKDGRLCISEVYNTKDCDKLAKEKNNDPKNIKLKLISCGHGLRQLTGDIGYNNPSHWCKIGFDSLFRPLKPTRKIILTRKKSKKPTVPQINSLKSRPGNLPRKPPLIKIPAVKVKRRCKSRKQRPMTLNEALKLIGVPEKDIGKKI